MMCCSLVKGCKVVLVWHNVKPKVHCRVTIQVEVLNDSADNKTAMKKLLSV